jgi:eukaryotic-like serine/threonine-protein kinase
VNGGSRGPTHCSESVFILEIMADEDRPSLAARLADAIGDNYTIEGEIGRGGMGVVYAARDLRLKRRVAIKVLPPDLAYRSDVRTRFMREAQTAARLSHPNIVPIHDVGDADGLVYFVMGFVDGESLGARLKRRGRLPIEEVRRIMKETADALGLAHTMGVIHRDVKPDNILLDGTRRRVMVTDFGIAKALSEVGTGTLTGTGVAIGTPTYMSPEQAAGEGEIDHRSDLYALGVVAYEMLTGRVPFKAPTVPAILMKQITEPPPDILAARPETPEELAATIMRCLEKDPAERWPTADALRRALDSRTSGPYRPPARRSRSSLDREAGPTGQRARSRRRSADRGRPPLPSSRRGYLEKNKARHQEADRPRERGAAPTAPGESEFGEPKIVRSFRSSFASYVSVNGSLLLLNILTTGLAPPWFLFCAIPWGMGLASQYGKLWSAGYSWRDVIDRPPAPDAVEAPKGVRKGGQARLPALPEPDVGDFGNLGPQIAQMRNDRHAIMQIVDRLPDSERQMLPDVVPTVDALMKRALELAKTLHQMEGEVDVSALDSLDRRIEAAQQEVAGKEDKRRLDLLCRQRQTLADLINRRGKVETQFESCVLAVQNMRFDLLRLRSAGVAAVLEDITQVTQQAKALNIDINAAIDAAGEIKAVLREGGSPSPST